MLMRARNIVKKCYISSDKMIKKGVTVSMADKEEKQAKGYKPVWIIVAFLVLIIINFLPTPDELSVVGLRALSVLAFAVSMWVTEAVKYTESEVMIVVLLIILLGLSPVPTYVLGESI